MLTEDVGKYARGRPDTTLQASSLRLHTTGKVAVGSHRVAFGRGAANSVGYADSTSTGRMSSDVKVPGATLPTVSLRVE